jgi:hypothetical protein
VLLVFVFAKKKLAFIGIEIEILAFFFPSKTQSARPPLGTRFT